MKEKTNRPIAVIAGKTIIDFYPTLSSAKRDGYDPNAIYRVCTGKQKTHKGKRFRFARESEYDFITQLHYVRTKAKTAKKRG